ncbi:MAG: amidase family protein [Pseudomonadota bacterium]
MTEPCDLSALEARRLIGAGRLDPVDLFESCTAREDAVNPALNAVVHGDRTLGRAQAEAASRAVKGGDALGPLHGLPIAIKDNRAVAGLCSTHGSLVHAEDAPATHDDPMIARLRAAGALLYARTNQPEFGTGANTKNRVWGATGNPFDPTRTPSGSSGGSAVAVATGMAPLATGSDYGGSLRTPAAFCGVAGFRPSPGTVPMTGAATVLQPWAVNGPMARSAEDCALMLAAMAFHDDRDPWSRPGPLSPATVPDVTAIRIAVSPDLGCAAVDAEIRAAFDRRLAILSDMGAQLIESCPDFGPVHDMLEATRAVAFLAGFADLVERDRARLDTNLLDNVDRAERVSIRQVARAEAEQAAAYRRFTAFFDGVDVLLAPAASVSPFPHETLFPVTVGGVAMDTYMRWLALAYAPTLCLATAAAIPAGRDGLSMPFGLQVIGPCRSDAATLAAAIAVERALALTPESARPVPDIASLAAAAG